LHAGLELDVQCAVIVQVDKAGKRRVVTSSIQAAAYNADVANGLLGGWTMDNAMPIAFSMMAAKHARRYELAVVVHRHVEM
jgi:hypothetical protein